MRGGRPVRLYAPDAAEKDGLYYLFYCTSEGEEGTAVAEHPAGPFRTLGVIADACGGIDPAVLRDDDGTFYYYWGQNYLSGARLGPDMVSLVPGSIRRGLLTEYEHGFHEGASIRKANGKYYLLYTDISRGRASCLSYAVADAPLGPFRKGGVVIDNTYCDPESWNNHGSIECFHGQWFVFYHRSSRGSRFSRRVCAEKIFFRSDGSIGEVPQTSSGAAGAFCRGDVLPAAAVCRMRRSCRLAVRQGCEALESSGGLSIRPNWAEFRYVDLRGCTALACRACGRGRLTLYADGGLKLCEFSVDCAEPAVFSAAPAVCPPLRAGTLWVTFEGETLYLFALALR